MAFTLFNDSTQGAILVVSCVLLPLCTLATILRFNFSRRTQQNVGLEDWFALAAWAMFLIYVTIVLIIVFILNGNDFSGLTMDQLLYLAKLVYANSLFYWLNQFFAKLCILLLYRRIFSVKAVYRWSIYSIAVVHILFTIAVLLVALFGCQPIAKGWNPTLPGSCVTTAPRPFLAGAESINSAVDFVMVVLAIFMIRDLNMSTSNKLKISILFVLGGLAGVIGFVKISQLYATGGGSRSRAVNTTIGLWTIVQQGCSIICCCAPIYKSLFPSSATFMRIQTSLTSWTRSWRLSSRQTDPSHASWKKSNEHGNGDSRGPRGSDSAGNGHWVQLDGSSQKRLNSAGGVNSYEVPLEDPVAEQFHFPMNTMQSGNNGHKY